MPAPRTAHARARALSRAVSLLAIGTAERLRPPPTRDAADIPRSPAQLGPDWLSAALCARAPGARVLALTQLQSSEGTTTRARLRVAYNDAGRAAGLPEHLFVKCTSSIPQRLMLGLGGLLDGEPGFYTHIRPRLALETPAGHFAALDRRSWRSIVVLEDVTATRGARFALPGMRLRAEQVRALLSQVAAWHGALWRSPLLQRLGWPASPAAQMRVIDALLGLADRLPAGLRRAREVIPDGVWRRRGQLLCAMRRSLQELSKEPRTLLHGDLHVANTYLTADGRPGVCDWQVVRQGGWAHDVSYLLASALAVEERRRAERELLGHYLEQLARAGGRPPAWEEAWRSYRAALLYPLFAWLYTLGRARFQPSFQPPSLALELVGRLATAVDDLQAFSAT